MLHCADSRAIYLICVTGWRESVVGIDVPPLNPPQCRVSGLHSICLGDWCVLLQLRSGGGPFKTAQAPLPDWAQLWSSAQIVDDVGSPRAINEHLLFPALSPLSLSFPHPSLPSAHFLLRVSKASCTCPCTKNIQGCSNPAICHLQGCADIFNQKVIGSLFSTIFTPLANTLLTVYLEGRIVVRVACTGFGGRQPRREDFRTHICGIFPRAFEGDVFKAPSLLGETPGCQIQTKHMTPSQHIASTCAKKFVMSHRQFQKSMCCGEMFPALSLSLSNMGCCSLRKNNSQS